MVEVREFGFAGTLDDEQLVEVLLDGTVEYRHQHAATVGVPIDVEPRRIWGLLTLAEHRPQRLVEVLGYGDRHVVGDDVDDDADPRGRKRLTQRGESSCSTELRVDLGVVDDVVTVRRCLCGAENR